MRRTPARAASVAVALVATCGLASACGSSASPGVANLGSTTTTSLAPAAEGGGSEASSRDYADAVAYASCMHAHGIVGFPQPNAEGNFLITAKDHLAQGSPQFGAADDACQHLLPNGGVLTPAEQQAALAQALKFSECMRSHGLPTFPDPVAANGGVTLRIPRGIARNSPQLQSAMAACRSLSPGGNPTP